MPSLGITRGVSGRMSPLDFAPNQLVGIVLSSFPYMSRLQKIRPKIRHRDDSLSTHAADEVVAADLARTDGA